MLFLGLLDLVEIVTGYAGEVLNDHLSAISQTFFAEACPDFGDYATIRQYVN